MVEPRRFTVEEYERMGEVGIFAPAARVELLDGEIVAMSPIGPRHAGVVDAIAEQLYGTLPGRVTIRVQNPLRLLPRSEPQPTVISRQPRVLRSGGRRAACGDNRVHGATSVHPSG